ncbi:MAG: TetR/AcrR family transcriptional regulator [Kiritimatiellales bacterium]
MAKYSGTERTRETLIQAAGELAAEQGISNVSTRAVALRAGENIGSIHYHFGGKDGLFEAVIHEAMRGCVRLHDESQLKKLSRKPTPLESSKMIRKVISDEIMYLFRSGRPIWYAQVIYQLIQRDDALYDLFNKAYLDPAIEFMTRLIQIIKPGLGEVELFLHAALIKLPVFAHASYMKALLRRLKMETYSDDYLEKLEDLLVRQTQLLLGLPLDRPQEA